MTRTRLALWAVTVAVALAAGGCSSNEEPVNPTLVVNSLEDTASPPSGTITLRSALGAAASGDTITFDSSLNGGTIELALIANEHSTLLGEVYVGLDAGGDSKMLADGATIRKTQSAVVLEKLIGQFLFDKAAAGGGK